MIALAIDYLAPNPSFVVLVVLYVGLFIVWPFVQALRAGRALWAIAILLRPHRRHPLVDRGAPDGHGPEPRFRLTVTHMRRAALIPERGEASGSAAFRAVVPMGR